MRKKPKRRIISKPRKLGTIIFILAVTILFFSFKKFSLYLVFIGITGVITYFKKLYHFPVDISPLFFLQIVITRYYDLRFTLLFIILGYVIPALLAGAGMKWDSYAFVFVSLIANLFSLFIPSMDLQLVGYITSVIQYVGGIFIGIVSKPPFLAAADGFANVTNNLLWFLIFSDLVVFLMG